jgi:hypothetical protein
LAHASGKKKEERRIASVLPLVVSVPASEVSE